MFGEPAAGTRFDKPEYLRGGSVHLDPLDPRSWVEDDHEYRIYGDERAQTWCVVDRDDYLFFQRWRWNPKYKVLADGSRKLYLRRAVCEYVGAGVRGRTFTLYLHVEILRRYQPEPPSASHVYVDHRDGDSTNCRKINLRYATPRLNNLNRRGCCPHEELV